MSRDTRRSLLIVLLCFVLGAPLIFAPASDAGTTYLPMAFAVPPTPTAGPTPTPTLPPPTFNGCRADPNPNAAPHYPVRITSIDKSAETVTLRNTSTSAVDLTGWMMCSITGHQQHPIFGTLAPGQSVTFGHSGGPIWNNTTDDDGALYNPAGQLVSYFNS